MLPKNKFMEYTQNWGILAKETIIKEFSKDMDQSIVACLNNSLEIHISRIVFVLNALSEHFFIESGTGNKEEIIKRIVIDSREGMCDRSASLLFRELLLSEEYEGYMRRFYNIPRTLSRNVGYELKSIQNSNGGSCKTLTVYLPSLKSLFDVCSAGLKLEDRE